MKPQKIYVAGPYTVGDVAVNVWNAIEAGTRLLELGFIPFVPHLTHFWHIVTPQPYETWMKQDLEWLAACDAVLRLPGESAGADREVARATELHIPVYESVEWLLAAFPRSVGDDLPF